MVYIVYSAFLNLHFQFALIRVIILLVMNMANTIDKNRRPGGKSENQKLKSLLVEKVLLHETDEEHALSSTDIIAHLGLYGIDAERHGVARDINALINLLDAEAGIGIDDEDENAGLLLGYEIEYDASLRGYKAINRSVDINDLILLADCIHATRFITKSQENALIDALAHLCSKHQAERLHENNIVTIDRVRTKNKDMVQIIGTINEAIEVGCKITMRYLRYTLKKKEHPEPRKEPYKLSPFKLIMNDGFYYLLAYSDEKQRILTFRLDRMTNVSLTAEAREGEKLFREIGMSGFTKRVFNMFRGRTEHVGIRFIMSKLDTVIDRFGTGPDTIYTPVDAHHFILRTDVEISDAFFSWISGFRGGAVLIEPESVVDKYKAFLKDNAKKYGLIINE